MDTIFSFRLETFLAPWLRTLLTLIFVLFWPLFLSAMMQWFPFKY